VHCSAGGYNDSGGDLLYTRSMHAFINADWDVLTDVIAHYRGLEARAVPQGSKYFVMPAAASALGDAPLHESSGFG
jgi:hypothetical protein